MMKMNGKRLVALLTVALLLVMSCVGSVAETVTLADAVTTFENGCMAEKNDMTVVDLHGTWHEMGRQYGALLQRQLREVADLCEVTHADGIAMPAVGVGLVGGDTYIAVERIELHAHTFFTHGFV